MTRRERTQNGEVANSQGRAALSLNGNVVMDEEGRRLTSGCTCQDGDDGPLRMRGRSSNMTRMPVPSSRRALVPHRARRQLTLVLTALVGCGSQHGVVANESRTVRPPRIGARDGSGASGGMDEKELEERSSRKSIAGTYTSQPIVPGSTLLELFDIGIYEESSGTCAAIPSRTRGTWTVDDDHVVLRRFETGDSAAGCERSFLVVIGADGRIALVEPGPFEMNGLEALGVSTRLWRREPSDYWSQVFAAGASRRRRGDRRRRRTAVEMPRRPGHGLQKGWLEEDRVRDALAS